MSCRFDLYVSYSQLAVFHPGLGEPFNMWTDEQVESGYSWKAGSVSFKTPIEAGTCSVDIVESRQTGMLTAGAIEVPVDVPDDGKLEVASISDSRLIKVRAGKAMLRYEAVGENQLRLTFIYPATTSQFKGTEGSGSLPHGDK